MTTGKHARHCLIVTILWLETHVSLLISSSCRLRWTLLAFAAESSMGFPCHGAEIWQEGHVQKVSDKNSSPILPRTLQQSWASTIKHNICETRQDQCPFRHCQLGRSIWVLTSATDVAGLQPVHCPDFIVSLPLVQVVAYKLLESDSNYLMRVIEMSISEILYMWRAER
jgi:hypothetical protein